MTDNTKIETNSKTKALLLCGAIACPLFIIAFLIECAIRPSYNSAFVGIPAPNLLKTYGL
jgi:uncharacterized membrane protein SpoIIM required for sporulation